MSRSSNRIFMLFSLGVAIAIAVVVSPFASSDPDGLDRVARDLKFDDKAAETQTAQKLPFNSIFDEYAVRGVPEQIATPIAGLVGTLATFGLAWGLGKLALKGNRNRE